MSGFKLNGVYNGSLMFPLIFCLLSENPSKFEAPLL